MIEFKVWRGVIGVLTVVVGFAIPAMAAPSVNPPPESAGVESAVPDAVALTSSPWTVFQFGLCDPVQIYDKRYTVDGCRLNLFNTDNRRVNGFDFGFGWNGGKTVNGLQVAALSDSRSVNGCRMALIGNIKKRDAGLIVTGMSLGHRRTAIINGVYFCCLLDAGVAKEVNGFNFCGMGGFSGRVNGVRLGAAANIVEKMNGAQISAGLSKSGEMNGLQIGIVNWSDDIAGVQLGILNFATNNWLPFSVLMNFGF